MRKIILVLGCINMIAGVYMQDICLTIIGAAAYNSSFKFKE